MSKTIEEIKTQWAKDHSYENYFEFLDLTRKCDTDHVFIMDCAVTQIAKRYAQSQTQELQEQNSELIEMLSLVCMDMEERGRAYGDAYTMSKELLTKYNHLNKKP